jgi:parallel beta-helix repeat protein
VLSGNYIYSNTACNDGGGVYLRDNANAILSGNYICSNMANDDNGGGVSLGVYLLENTDATLHGNNIYGNVASGGEGSGNGGGVFAFGVTTVALHGNTIYNNTATGDGSYNSGDGGGVFLITGSAFTLSDNIIYNNTANNGYGGGVLTGLSYDITLSGNTIYSNTADEPGGGAYIAGITTTLSGNAIYNNTTNDDGGGILLASENTSLDNNIIADNQIATPDGVGSGIYAVGGGTLDLRHNTIARNTGGDGSGLHVTIGWDPPSVVTMTNNILVSHTVGITVASGCTVTLESTLWGTEGWANITDWDGSGTIITGANNYRGAPAFVDPALGDYHIGPASMAMDKGVDAGVTADIDGDPRPSGPAPDLGADEIIILDHRSYLPLIVRSS